MAYGFEKKCAKENKTVELYLSEGMLFEAWIVIIQESEVKDGQELYDELEREIYKSSTKLTDEEAETLYAEFFEYRNC